MKSFTAFGLPVICAVFVAIPATAQLRARSGALGGSFASRGISRPLGGIIRPPLGGVGVGVGVGLRGERPGRRRAITGYPYAYSVFIPNYFDNFYDDPAAGYGSPYAAAPAVQAYAPPAPAQPPVIINQYFGMQSAEPSPAATANPVSNTQAAPGDLIGAPQNYYLIAYKNHAVYAAIAYWVEDKTLHYVTTQNTHNQASLDLVDLDLTKSLNQARDVPFTLTPQ